MEEILLSVVCVTYNHAPYIRDAIEGFLMQKVNFGWEILIHDDASTDGTEEIVREYEAKYPDLIRGFYEKENCYSREVPFSGNWEQAPRGKYQAFCEGDDCWTDEDKLQMQVDFLESHPDYSMTFHAATRMYYKSGTQADTRFGKGSRTYLPYEIILRPYNNLPTASIVARREVFELSGFFLEAGIGDVVWQVSSMLKGKIYYFDRVMSIYRYGVPGSWTYRHSEGEAHYKFVLKADLLVIRFWDKLDEYTDRQYSEYISIAKAKLIFSIVMSYSSGKTRQEFLEDCDDLAKKQPELLKYCDRVIALYDEFSQKSYHLKEIKELAEACSHIVIYGAGEYAEILDCWLKYNNISFEGFMVTEKKEGFDSYCDKPVWQIDDLPFDYDEVGVLVGIDMGAYYDLVRNMDNAGLKHYLFPFWID